MQLGTVMIYAKDLPLMAAFYEQTLGLPAIAETRTEHWVELRAGAVKIALHAIPAHIAAEIKITSPPEAREQTPLKLLFAVPNVAAEAARLKALGVTIFERPWGGCDAMDPEGNIFGLVTQL